MARRVTRVNRRVVRRRRAGRGGFRMVRNNRVRILLLMVKKIHRVILAQVLIPPQPPALAVWAGCTHATDLELLSLPTRPPTARTERTARRARRAMRVSCRPMGCWEALTPRAPGRRWLAPSRPAAPMAAGAAGAGRAVITKRLGLDCHLRQQALKPAETAARAGRAVARATRAPTGLRAAAPLASSSLARRSR